MNFIERNTQIEAALFKGKNAGDVNAMLPCKAQITMMKGPKRYLIVTMPDGETLRVDVNHYFACIKGKYSVWSKELFDRYYVAVLPCKPNGFEEKTDG